MVPARRDDVPAAKKPAARKTTATAARKRPPAAREEPTRDPPKAKALPPKRNVRIALPPDVDKKGRAVAGLTPTDKPGVFINSAGAFVDQYNVLVSLAMLGNAEQLLDEQIIGKKVETPAELMKRIALDPRLPLTMRLDAAKGAAPYYDKKTPIATENTNVDKTIDMAVLAKVPAAKRAELLSLLKGLGVDLGAV